MSPRLAGAREHQARAQLFLRLADDQADPADAFRLRISAINECRAVVEVMLEAAEQQELPTHRSADPKASRRLFEGTLVDLPHYSLIERMRIHDFHRFGLVPPAPAYEVTFIGGPLKLRAQGGGVQVALTDRALEVQTTGNSRAQLQRPIVMADGKFLDDDVHHYFAPEEIASAFLSEIGPKVEDFAQMIAPLAAPSPPVSDLFAHQPPPRADGRLPITITHLEMVRADWTERSRAPEIDVSIEHVRTPTAAFYRELYDRVGRPWLWYERRLLSDDALQTLLDQSDHELHVARHDGDLVGYFELSGDDLAFFGLTLPYIGRRIGPWLLDRAIERAFARGVTRIDLNTNTLDHPKALDTYRKAGFRPVRSEAAELRDPRVLWPEVYRWPPK